MVTFFGSRYLKMALAVKNRQLQNTAAALTEVNC
jgi:hypothetical protein